MKLIGKSLVIAMTVISLAACGNMSRTQKIQQLAPLSVVQQAICLGGNAATTLGGAALGGVIGSQVNKGGDYDDREYRHHKRHHHHRRHRDWDDDWDD